MRKRAWEGARQGEDRELKSSSKRRRIDRRRRRKSQTPVAEALSSLFGWRRLVKPRREVTDCRAQRWTGPHQTTLGWSCCEQPHCNNSGAGGLKGDTLAGIGLQPRQSTFVDAETSPSDRGKLKCNPCKGSFPVYERLCVQTCGESGNGN